MTNLLNLELILNRYSPMIHADSHGSSGPSLGLGLLYYGLSQAIQSQVSVCIGSGAGFVPGLLRQAQKDIVLEPAVTYLIDANLPDLGFGGPTLPGGWMTENSDFLEWAKDVIILRMLSRDAVGLFARGRLRIDYLHIDGDHSKSGVLADLRMYAPLTSSGAVISLHDYNLSSVSSAVSDFLESSPGWEKLSFAEIGSGCCFLRQRPPLATKGGHRRDRIPEEMLPPLIFNEIAVIDSESAVLSAQYERWPYLKSAGFRIRYEIAARFVDSSGLGVVEVGGFPNSIVPFLDRCPWVYAVEPYVPVDHEADIRRSAADKSIDVTFYKGTAGNCALNVDALGRFNLVALGFDLSEGIDSEKAALQDLKGMAELLKKAEIAVLELPQYTASQIAWECLDKALRPHKIHEMVLDLREDPSAIEYLVTDGRAVRRIIVVKGTAPRTDEEIQKILEAGASELIKLRPAHLIREDPVYHFGEVVRFGQSGNCTRYLRRGWSFLEDNWVWCHGVSSCLNLRLAEEEVVDPATTYLLHIHLWPAGNAESHPSQRLEIKINNERIFSDDLALGRQNLAIPIQGEVLLRREMTEIVFDHPDAIQPCRLDPMNSKDLRSLAFAFESLSITGSDETVKTEAF